MMRKMTHACKLENLQQIDPGTDKKIIVKGIKDKLTAIM
jgi:hypothetical protein